jgi:hypothetical protein
MMDRESSEFKIGYQGRSVYPVGVVYTVVGYHPGLSGYYPTSAEGGKPEAAGKFCSILGNTVMLPGTSVFQIMLCLLHEYILR